MYSMEQRVEALRILSEHGGCVRSAAREAGVSHGTLAAWARGSAMGLGRKPAVHLTPEQKAGAVSRVLGGEAPRAVASSVGVVTETLAGWVRAARSGAWEGVLGVAAERTTLPEGLPDDPEALKAIIRDMQMRLDIAREVVEVVKKDPGADPAALTNREKALVVNALRGDYSVTSLTSRLGMAGSCYHYWRVRLAEPDPLAGLRREVLRIFEASGRAWGYRRVWRQLRSEGTRVSEKVVRRLMREGGMAVAYDRKRRRAYDSYAGEVSDRPPNLLYVEEARDVVERWRM